MSHDQSSVKAARRHYYSSSQGPFYNANNIFMFYGGGDRGQILETIIRSLPDSRQAFHIYGESGSGKTMLSLVLNDRLKHRCHTIRYDLEEINAAKLLRHLLIELCPQYSDLISASQAQTGASKPAMDAAIRCIENQITENSRDAHSKPYALFVDTPAELDSHVLHVIRRLNSIRLDDQSWMHCFVFQKTESADDKTITRKLESDLSAQYRFKLRHLTLAEVSEYLHHHMMLFDFNRRDLFTREMAYFIADRSDGLFRSINNIARNAFTIATLEDADKLSMSHLLMAGLPDREEPSTKSGFSLTTRQLTIALTGISVVALSALTFFSLM